MRSTPIACDAQEPKGARRPPHCTIPTADDPCGLAVYDGRTLAGHVVEHDGWHFAFDSTGTLIGDFRTRAEALCSLPMVAFTGGVS